MTFVVEDDLKEKYLKGIDIRWKLLRKLKSEINKRYSEIIDFTIIKCREITKKLNDEKKYYSSVEKYFAK